MGSRGDCFDNSVLESFHASLKKDLIYRRSWPTKTEARTAIFDYVETFYNRQRRHSRLGAGGADGGVEHPDAGRARAASIALAVTVVSSLLAGVTSLLAIYVFGVAITATSDVADDERWLDLLAVLETVAALTVLATTVVAGVVFLVWFHRAHRVLASANASPRHSPAWAVGSWFVPFVNLVIPKQAANDLWRAGAPDRVPGFVHAWWALWLTSGVLRAFVGLVIADVGQDGKRDGNFDAVVGLYLLYLLASVLAIAAAVLAIRLVRESSRRLEALPGAQGPVSRPDAVSLTGAART